MDVPQGRLVAEVIGCLLEHTSHRYVSVGRRSSLTPSRSLQEPLSFVPVRGGDSTPAPKWLVRETQPGSRSVLYPHCFALRMPARPLVNVPSRRAASGVAGKIADLASNLGRVVNPASAARHHCPSLSVSHKELYLEKARVVDELFAILVGDLVELSLRPPEQTSRKEVPFLPFRCCLFQ